MFSLAGYFPFFRKQPEDFPMIFHSPSSCYLKDHPTVCTVLQQHHGFSKLWEPDPRVDLLK